MAVTLTCDHPGCGRKFTHPTKGRASQAINLHKRKSHGTDANHRVVARAAEPAMASAKVRRTRRTKASRYDALVSTLFDLVMEEVRQGRGSLRISRE